MTQLHNLRLKAFLRGLSGADFRVFGAERLVFLLSGAFLRDFGAGRQVFPLSGADFGVFGAADLPGLTPGREWKREGRKGWYDFVEVRS